MTQRNADSAAREPWGLAAALAAGTYALALAHPIDLVPADLGRHLMNGRVFLETLSPPTTNLYSYTAPGFPTVAHHWGAGVVFHLAWRLSGFAGLQVFFILLSAAALVLAFDAARRAGGTAWAALCVLAAVPLLAERSEIRPEAFSYFLAAAFYGVLSGVSEGRLRTRWLLLLPLLEPLWVNLHIYFFLGPALIAAFLLQERLRPKRDLALEKALATALGLSLAGCLLNPRGLWGALSPALVFRNYGYRVAENQPVWRVEHILDNPNFLLFKIWLGALAAAVGARWVRTGRPPAAQTLVAAGVSLMALSAIRNFALFGLFAPIALAEALAALAPAVRAHAAARQGAGAALAAVLIVILGGQAPRAMHVRYPLGLGLAPGGAAGGRFLQENGIRGPIFNDYDVGGYLIFHLFPRERVFVDNRPEAYSESFFKDVYVPMQQDDAVWKAQDARWGFNAIVFNLRDLTPWGQAFMIRRVQDPAWAPVFAESSVLVLLKRNAQNSALIARYEIPKSRFTVVRQPG